MGINPQYVVLFHYFRVFLERAAELGMDAAPLKGAHLLTDVYPEGEDRGPLSDVDFLVKPKDWEITLQLLTEMGFVRRGAPGRTVTAKGFYEAGFYLSISDTQRILFEPHRYLVQPRRLQIDYDALWARSVSSTFDGAPCRRLSAEDHVLYSAVHLASNSFVSPSRELRDLSLLFSQGRADIDVVIHRAGEWRVERAVWLALKLLHESELSLHLESAVRRLAPPYPIQAYLGWLVPDSTGFRFKNANFRLNQAVLWPAVFDGVLDFGKFAAYYAGLRVKDLAARMLHSAD